MDGCMKRWKDGAIELQSQIVIPMLIAAIPVGAVTATTDEDQVKPFE